MANSTKSLSTLLIVDENSPLVRTLLESKFKPNWVISFDGRNSEGLSLTRIRRWFRLDGTDLSPVCNQFGVQSYKLHHKDFKSLETILENAQADIIILYCVPLMPNSIIDKANRCMINLHPAFLPEYRGSDPVTHAFLDGNTASGITIHRVDAGEDTGDIFAQQRIDFLENDTFDDFVSRAVNDVGAKLLIDVLQSIEEDSLTAIPQPKVSPTPQARRLNNQAIIARINFFQSPVETIWKCLKFFEQRILLDLLEVSGWRRCLTAKLISYTRSSTHFDKKEQCPRIEFDGLNFSIIASHGIVYGKFKFSLKQVIKQLPFINP